jgi:uncharacterized membrane protein
MLVASSTASLGQYTLTITGTSGAMSATTTVSLGVYAQNFTLSDYSIVTLGQGSSTTSYVNINSQYGFSGSVNLSLSGLPSGVTGSWSQNPATSSSTLTLTASSTASLGQYTLTITGTSGSLSATTTLSLGVFEPSFTLYDYNSMTLGQGGSSTSYVNVNPQNGFTGSVNLAVTSGLPSGVTASFAPNPTTGLSTLTLTASSTASLGQYTLTITGTSGSLSATTTVSLGVFAPSFTLSGYGSVSLGQGSSSTSYVNVNPQNGFTGSVTLAVTSGLPSGVTASFAPNPTTGTSTLTLTASSNASLGQYTLTITGTSGSLSSTTTVSLSVFAQSFTLSAGSQAIAQGSSGTSYVYVSPQYGFAGSVNLAVSGLPSGVTASFSPNPTTGNSVLTLTASSTASLGQYTLTITGTSGSVEESTTVPLNINPASFLLSESPTYLSIGQGSSGTSTIAVTPVGSFTGSVTLAATALPSGVTASFAPNPTTGASVLTLTASSSAAVGLTYVTITGTCGSQSASTSLQLNVNVPGFTLSGSPSSVSVAQGGSGTSTITVNPFGGFTSSVTLAATGLPTGVTASFAPNPTAGTSVITLTASSSAALGTLGVTINGTFQRMISGMTLGVVVVAPEPVSTTTALSIAPGGGTLAIGAPYTLTAAVNPASGSSIPTGSVVFTIGSATQTVALNSSGVATYSGTAPATDGTLTFSAAYQGTPAFSASTSNSISVAVTTSAKTSPTITWVQPADISYGTALSPTQLDASSTVAGTFAYSPTAGAMLSVGRQTLTVTFTPTDSTNYTTAAASVTLTVIQATPVLSWMTPAAISYGTALSATQLDAGSTLAGVFAYSPAAGAVLSAGLQTLAVTFTPTDFTDYTPATASVTLTVNKAATLVSLIPSSSSITTAQALTVTVAVRGAGGSSTPTGSVILTSGNYSSSSTTLSGGDASINVPAGSLATGADTLTVSYTGDANFNSSAASASITVTTLVSPAFTVTGTAATVAAGSATGNASTITVSPSGGFTGSVALTATVTSSPAGAQYTPTLSFGSTSPVSIADAAAGTATLTISTTAATSATLASPKRPGIPWYAASGATLACLLLFGIPARRRSWRTMLGMLVLLASFACGAVACGGGGGSGGGGGGGGTGHAGTTAGTYTVTVTAKSGNITAQGPITLTVQ